MACATCSPFKEHSRANVGELAEPLRSGSNLPLPAPQSKCPTQGGTLLWFSLVVKFRTLEASIRVVAKAFNEPQMIFMR